jgi:hypothetical protein
MACFTATPHAMDGQTDLAGALYRSDDISALFELPPSDV